MKRFETYQLVQVRVSCYPDRDYSYVTDYLPITVRKIKNYSLDSLVRVTRSLHSRLERIAGQKATGTTLHARHAGRESRRE